MTNTGECDVVMPEVEEETKISTNKDDPSSISNYEQVLHLIEDLKKTMLHTTEINSAKVQQVTEEITAGKYQIHSQLIAEKLLTLMELQTKEEPEIT